MRNKLLFLLLSCVLMSGFSQAFDEEADLKIIAENWPPYNYEENGEIEGFSTDIVKAILEELNSSYEIHLLPGARGENLLNERTHVMNFSLFRTSEREKRYRWIEPIAQETLERIKAPAAYMQIYNKYMEE